MERQVTGWRLCTVCKDEHTVIHGEVMPGVVVAVCETCLELAKTHFVWICVQCGRSFLRRKEEVIALCEDEELRRAYHLCRNEQIVQGLDGCCVCARERGATCSPRI